MMIPSGRTLGIVGGGAMTRLLARAAQSLGYRVHVLAATGAHGAGLEADEMTIADTGDVRVLGEFAGKIDVLTVARADIPAEWLAAVETRVPVRPGSEVLRISADRLAAKSWLHARQLPHVRFAEALDGDVVAAVAQVGRPCVIKPVRVAADGHGQMRIGDDGDLAKAAAIFRGRPCLVERWIDVARELAVVVARTAAGETRVYPVTETIHPRQVLELTITPARIGAPLAREAEQLATTIAAKLEVVGVIAVEFLVSGNGDLHVSEFTPGLPATGLWTIDGSETGMAEQHVRAICGLPLGAVAAREPVVMARVRGDLPASEAEREPGRVRWEVVLREPAARLHVSPAAAAAGDRTLGWFSLRGPEVEGLIEQARVLKLRLQG